MAKEEKVQIKVFFTLAQMRVLRLAAASCNVTPTAYLRQSGLAAAAEEMRHFKAPCLPSSEPLKAKAQRGSRKA